MTEREEKKRPRPTGRRSGPWPALIIAGLLVAVPLMVLVYQARHSGLSVGQMFAHIFKGARPPRPWHSVQWLENRGGMKFEHRPIGKFEGASGAVAADIDGGGDLDVVAVSCYNFWEKADSRSMIWFENDGKMNFTGHDIAHSPTHLISLEAADMNNDGKPDIITIRMNVYPPFTKDGRVTLWLNYWGAGRSHWTPFHPIANHEMANSYSPIKNWLLVICEWLFAIYSRLERSGKGSLKGA
jgi:hypothetical protein